MKTKIAPVKGYNGDSAVVEHMLCTLVIIVSNNESGAPFGFIIIQLVIKYKSIHIIIHNVYFFPLNFSFGSSATSTSFTTTATPYSFSLGFFLQPISIIIIPLAMLQTNPIIIKAKKNYMIAIENLAIK